MNEKLYNELVSLLKTYCGERYSVDSRFQIIREIINAHYETDLETLTKAMNDVNSMGIGCCKPSRRFYCSNYSCRTCAKDSIEFAMKITNHSPLKRLYFKGDVISDS